MSSPLIRALVAACLAALPMTAQASDARTTVRVDVHALDLSAPSDVTTAQRRIARAAKVACRNDVEHLTVKARRAARECRDTMRGLALQKQRARQQQQLASQ
ncbi:UrcA family protein [Sphingopyxis sp.]|uniref:UrcA family protein n=1 Tax=Sphingopyxis sp. TaxID=1908224 RepID=UPI001D3C166B|nr:UrcA family protein [Sphingopyxis sp.]MBW8296470.1 UrcA family protein [Sphingopyxis sp.]